MANEESNVGGVGRLLGTATLQKSLDTLNKSVAALTGAVMSTGSKVASSGVGTAAAGFGTWAKKDWNSGSNYANGRSNGGGATFGGQAPGPQPTGKQYNNTLLGGASRGRDPQSGQVMGNGGHSLTRTAAGAAGYVVASGVAQMSDRVLMNTTSSMLNRTAVNGNANSMWKNNYTSHGTADTAAAQQTVQRMGYAAGSGGYNLASSYVRTAGLVDPSISQAQAGGALATLHSGRTYNNFRAFGIATIKPGGAPVAPRELSHQLIGKIFAARGFPKGKQGIEAALGQNGSIGQTLDKMVSNGTLDANTASQVSSMARAELTAKTMGKSYGEFAGTLDKYAGKNGTGREGTAALKAIGLAPTDAAKLTAVQGNKFNQLGANNDAFSAGLGAATDALGQFSNMLTSLLRSPAGQALGAGQGFGGGVAGTLGGIASGGSQLGGMYLASKVLGVGGRGAGGGAGGAAGKGIGGILGKGAKGFTAKGVGIGAAAAIGGNIAGGLIQDGKGGARDKWGAATSGAANGAGLGATIGTLIEPGGGTAVGAALGGVIGGALGYFTAGDGQAGGAATSSGDRPGGPAAKATGTVGAGKTAANVIAVAKKYLGVPYVYGGTTPKGFDCSGFTKYVFKQVGINLPRVSGAQQTAGKQVAKKDAQPGDLLFMGGNAKTGGAFHVAIMISSGQIIEAAKTGTNVRIRSFSMDEFATVGRFLGSLGNLSGDPVANTDGQSSSTGSGSGASGATAAFGGGFTGNALNEMDALNLGGLGASGAGPSGLGTTSTSGNPSSATKAVGADGGTSNSGGVSLSGGNGNAQKAFNTLVGQGFSAQAAAGVIGNLMQESGVNPNSHQSGGGPGRGIMQWTVNERWATLKKWAGKRDPWALDTQVGFMLKEMNDAGVSGALKGMTDVNKATDFFEKKMERAGTPNMPRRYSLANEAFKSYNGGSGKGYAVGSTNIDVDQNARIHKGEMIIPAHQAEAVRQALTGNSPLASIGKAGGGGVVVTFGPASIKITLGAGATPAMGTQIGRRIVDTIVNDTRLSNIAKGI